MQKQYSIFLTLSLLIGSIKPMEPDTKCANSYEKECLTGGCILAACIGAGHGGVCLYHAAEAEIFCTKWNHEMATTSTCWHGKYPGLLACELCCGLVTFGLFSCQPEYFKECIEQADHSCLCGRYRKFKAHFLNRHNSNSLPQPQTMESKKQD